MQENDTEEVVVETTETAEEVQPTRQEEPAKPTETPEARVARLRRQLKQAEKAAGVDDEPERKPSKKSDDLDYGQKAFLVASGVKEADEIALAKEFVSNTGKSLDDVLASKHFQAELNDLRETKASLAAVPSSGNRTGQSAQDTVEYWIAKGELPPASERELRTKVVNARINKEKGAAKMFTDNPVAST